MKILGNAIIILITLVFAIQAAGFYFVNHYCLYSGNKEIFFSERSEYSCCNNTESCCCTVSENNDDSNETKSTCFLVNTASNHESCCITEKKYIKNNSDYLKPQKELLQTGFLIKILLDDQIKFHPEKNIFANHKSEYPPGKVNSELLIRTGKLIL